MRSVSLAYFERPSERLLKLFHYCPILQFFAVNPQRFLTIFAVVARVALHGGANLEVHGYSVVVGVDAAEFHSPRLLREFEITLPHDDVVVLEAPLRRERVWVVPCRESSSACLAPVGKERRRDTELVFRKEVVQLVSRFIAP